MNPCRAGSSIPIAAMQSPVYSAYAADAKRLDDVVLEQAVDEDDGRSRAAPRGRRSSGG